MTSKRPVKVFWYSAEEKGRKAPPGGPEYYGVLRTKSKEQFKEEWSVLLEMPSLTSSRYIRDAMLSFVSDKAPVASLQPGRTFYLFEGRWPVAEGVVLEDEAEA